MKATTQKWKDETITQAKALALREQDHRRFEAFKMRVIEIVAQYNGHSSHAPEDTCIEEIISEISEMTL